MTQPEQAKTLGRLKQVDTRFHRESVRAGGVNRATAVRQVAQVMEAVQPDLESSVKSSLAAISGSAAELELQEQPEKRVLRKLRDQVRELRDVGSLADFPMLTSIAAMLSDVLSHVVAGRAPYRVDVVRCFTDALDLFGTDDKRGVSTLEQPELLADLRRMQHLFVPAE